MKKNNIIKDSSIFEHVIHSGRIIKNKYYNLFIINNSCGKPLFGFAVGKKIGNAVTRNKNKRQIKSIVDNNMSLFSNPCYYIIMLKKAIVDLSYKEKEYYLIDLLNKGEKHEK